MNKLYRNDLNKYKRYFTDAAKLLGIEVEYQYMLKRNTEEQSGESVYSKLSKPINISVIVEQGVPLVDSLKQLGWFMDTDMEQILVDFPFDTPNLQEGCRFKFISNENEELTKEYTIIKLSSEVLYPTCIKCLCQPVMEDECVYHDRDSELSYGQQEIDSDEENMSFINEKPKITFF